MTEQERNELITELFEIGLTVEQQIIVTQLLSVTNNVTQFQPLSGSARTKKWRENKKRDAVTSHVTSVTKEEKVSHTLPKEENLPKENTPKGVQKKRVQIEFEEHFWPKYPRKVGKGAALKAFFRAREKASTEEIVAGVGRLSAQKLETQFTPHPATWLNQDRWLDETPLKANGILGGSTNYLSFKSDWDLATARQIEERKKERPISDEERQANLAKLTKLVSNKMLNWNQPKTEGSDANSS